MYLGLLIPVRAVIRLPLSISTRSFDGRKLVKVRAKTTKIASSEQMPGGVKTVYRVGFIFDHNEIWLARFTSSSDARAEAKEISDFLRGWDGELRD